MGLQAEVSPWLAYHEYIYASKTTQIEDRELVSLVSLEDVSCHSSYCPYLVAFSQSMGSRLEVSVPNMQTSKGVADLNYETKIRLNEFGMVYFSCCTSLAVNPIHLPFMVLQ